MLGVMVDCSRNAVMNVDGVKKFADIIGAMGYDTLMLYTEDTYEIDNNPLFGCMRGRYSKAELKDIDSYCSSAGIELVPCIQTLAHLENMFKWKEYGDINDCDDILLADDERTYKMIDSMFSALSECFSSRKIHIGMDEAYNVGKGRYKDIHGGCDRFEVINRHLHKVCGIAGKYGFEPMIWSDMFCRLALDTEDYYNPKNAEKIEQKSDLPSNVSLVYWDYYSTDYDRYVSMIKTNKLFGKKVYFAGGAWTWSGFAPDNLFSIRTMDAAIRACSDCGIDDILFTAWGDDGGECSPFAVLPSLMYASEKLKGNDDIESIKAKFKDITSCSYDDFILLDALNLPGGKHPDGNRDEGLDTSEYGLGTSKYLFYNDLFTGLKDRYCSHGDCEYYKELALKLGSVKADRFENMFKAYEAFAAVLSVKADLGLRIRGAYRSGNSDGLNAVISDCSTLLKLVEDFYNTYKKWWFTVNKPHGFDIQDIRLGGMMQRIKSCRDRLVDYVNGEITEIPELEEDIPQGEINDRMWCRIASPNLISHHI